ncbi:MAG: hypothetical protein OXH31_00395 [Gammaproteobacteria bacterium]|nr:hypothetical protein [Gammaproteobacteria bacterium]
MCRHDPPIRNAVRHKTSPATRPHGKARAVKATAHEIARLVYAMLRDGTEYVERSIEEFEKEYLQPKLAHSRRQVHATGCVLTPRP